MGRFLSLHVTLKIGALASPGQEDTESNKIRQEVRRNIPIRTPMAIKSWQTF